MSNQHALPYAGECKTWIYANRTRSQVLIQPSLLGNSQNLPKKAKIIKERGQFLDPWSGLSGPRLSGPRTIQSLPWPEKHKEPQLTTSSKELGANLIGDSTIQKRLNQTSIRKN